MPLLDFLPLLPYISLYRRVISQLFISDYDGRVTVTAESPRTVFTPLRTMSNTAIMTQSRYARRAAMLATASTSRHCRRQGRHYYDISLG
jgi:hypothetical protein